MMIRSLLICFMVLSHLIVHAQSKQCGFDQFLQQELSTNENYGKKLQNIERLIKTFSFEKSDTIIRIPIVFHIIYRTGAQNISNKQIISQLEVLNQDYRLLNSDTNIVDTAFYRGDAKIEFCFAGLDTNGVEFSGVTRKQTQHYQIGQNPSMLFGQHPVWNSEKYLNIYVCEIGNGTAGYASFPGSNPLQDAVVIDYSNFGLASEDKNYNLGRTVTHEVGHWLGLYHIWGVNQPDCNDDDLVADTPNQGKIYTGCPTGKKFSCGSHDMTTNYMGYVFDRCMGTFTPGQGSRMRAMIALSRPVISSSITCSADPIVTEEDSIVIYPLNVYPNPTAESIFIEQKEGYFSAAELTLFSTEGKEVPIIVTGVGDKVKVQLKTPNRGYFLLKIKIGEKAQVRKVLFGVPQR